MSKFDADKYFDLTREILSACEDIKDAGACEHCPLYCIEDDSWYEVVDFTTKKKLKDFFGLADDARNYAFESECDTYYRELANRADLARQDDAVAEMERWYD